MNLAGLMKPINKLRTTVAIAALVAGIAGMLASHSAHAVCIENGGTDMCTNAVFTGPASYTLCDDLQPAVFRLEGWCVARGGTWDPATVACSGTQQEVSPGSAAGIANAFETWLHGPSCGGAPGPGQCTNSFCTCTEGTSYGLTTYQFSVMPFSGRTAASDGSCPSSGWAENIVFGTHQPVGCPAGYAPGGDDPAKPCTKPGICWMCVGNPVDVGNGDKMQREIDYAPAAPGAVRFERFYNSGGFFDPARHQPVTTDFWRHTYSSKVYPYIGNSYVMAVVQRPNGALIPFDTNGVETQNSNGAAHRLQSVAGGGWILTTPESDVERYDSAGNLTSVTTRSGFVTTLSYDGNGRLQTATDGFGRSLTLTYNAAGFIDTMTDPSSRVYHYDYDSSTRLSMVTYPDLSTRTYLYEDPTFLWALTGIVDERGVRISTYAYDSQGRGNLTQHTGPDNQYTLGFNDQSNSATTTAHDGFNNSYTFTFSKINGAMKLTSDVNFALGTESRTYDTNGNPLTFTNRRGFQTTYVYDPVRNLETSRTEASGTSIARTIATTWNTTYRLPATITEPSGVSGVNLVTTFTYDTAGNLMKKNMTAGTKVREWNYTYNTRGQVLTIDGPRTDVTDVTTITYFGDADACVGCRGQVHTVTNPLGQVTSFDAYDGDGRVTQITDVNGVATTLTYKTRGWLASRSTAGETTSYDYDPAGNLNKITLPDGSWLSYEYDAAGALVGVGDSLGNSIDYELDVMGNRVGETVYDPAQVLRKSMQRTYNQANQLEHDIGAASQTTQYGYDGNGNVTTVTDPLNHVTTNTYDALDRLTNILDAASGNTVFTYDAKDRLASVQDPKLSVATTYTYDGLGNLATQISPDTGTTTFTYDNAGNVATQTDARSVATTYTYDSMNRVTSANVTDGGVTYEYDNLVTGGSYAKGRLTKVTDPSGNTTYVYDSLGRITTKTQTVTASPTNKTFTIGYSFSSGRQTGITYPSGRAVTYGFDTRGQIASITVDGTTTILNSAQYFPFGAPKQWTWGNGEAMTRTFDLDGRVATLTLGPSAGTYPDLSQVFGFDALNRMTSATLAAGQSQGFTYDANGNRTSATVNAASTAYTYPTTSHKLSSLSGATTRSFSYDNAGNTTASAGITYVYDGRGRMKQAGTAAYLVNGLGQRVKKTATGDTYFAYDEAGHLIGEYDSSGSVIEETVWLNNTPVAVLKPKTGGFDAFYIWSDNLGTPRQITDSTNTSRWEWANSDPFGNNSPNENPAGVGTFTYNLRFPGQYYDGEVGKHYNYFRDYDPALGRYVESDPIGLRAGPNTYGYVKNKPLRLVDPLGLKAQLCCKQIPGLPVAHCFVNEVQDLPCINPDSRTRTVGLQGPPPWGSSSHANAGEIHYNDPFDNPGQSTCGAWNNDVGVHKCIDRQIQKYADPSEYSAITGPNSNTFAATISQSCNLPSGNGFWPAPGWSHAPAGPPPGGK